MYRTLYFFSAEMFLSRLRISDSLSLVTAKISKNSVNVQHNALTGLALVPVHDQWSMEYVAVCLQSPDSICLVLCSLNNLANGAWSAQVLQDALELVCGWWFLCYVELELCALCLVVCVVGTSLVFGGGRDRVRIGLLENSVCAQGRLAGGLVEERDDVLHAMLEGVNVMH